MCVYDLEAMEKWISQATLLTTRTFIEAFLTNLHDAHLISKFLAVTHVEKKTQEIQEYIDSHKSVTVFEIRRRFCPQMSVFETREILPNLNMKKNWFKDSWTKTVVQEKIKPAEEEHDYSAYSLEQH